MKNTIKECIIKRTKQAPLKWPFPHVNQWPPLTVTSSMHALLGHFSSRVCLADAMWHSLRHSDKRNQLVPSPLTHRILYKLANTLQTTLLMCSHWRNAQYLSNFTEVCFYGPNDHNAQKNWLNNSHYIDVIMTTMASQITSLTVVYLNVYSDTEIKENTKAPRHWPLCGEFTGTGEFPAQRASYAENVSIWWRHHAWCGTGDQTIMTH